MAEFGSSRTVRTTQRKPVEMGGQGLGGLTPQAFRGLTEEQYKNLLSTLTQAQQQSMQAAQQGIEEFRGTQDFAREQAASRGQEQLSQATQSAQQRGLANTTILDTLQRGIHEDVGEQMRGIAAQEGQALAGLFQNLGQTAMQGGQMVGQGISQQLRPDAGQFTALADQLSRLGQRQSFAPAPKTTVIGSGPPGTGSQGDYAYSV